ncbi:MAG: ATPase, partial [Clostridiales bacterium]|nr:ATPase [Clostridiales bacterium]
MNHFFNKTWEDSLKQLETNEKSGLSDGEVKKRLAQHGENRLKGEKSKSLFEMFLDQFKDFMVLILIVAAVVSIVAMGDYLEGAIILAIVILNAILGVSQESKASNALKALQELSSPAAKVIRNGT